MRELKDFAEAEAVLEGYMRASMELTGKDITLERMHPIMTAIGNPEKRLRVIHIAGTSGKTSTTYYISSLLAAAGKKVGVTVSPHIDSIAERIQVNLKPLDENTFCKELGEFLDILESKNEVALSYFELLVAFAYWYFDKIGVDYAVIETGLGGMHDATNVAAEPDKICVITDIGYDHMQILGHTLPEIASQKAGIIHSGSAAYMYQQDMEIMRPVETRAAGVHASLASFSESSLRKQYASPALGGLPPFNQRNWLLARAVYEAVRQRDSLPKLDDALIKQSLATYIPARMDSVLVDGKTVVMDGAHNGQKMQAFLEGFKAQYPGVRPAVLLSLKSGKEYDSVVPLLAGIADSVIITSFHVSNDMYFTSMDLQQLADSAKQAGIKNVTVEPDQNAAFNLLLSQAGKTVVVTGSFYLIAQLRAHHKELRHA